MSNNMTMPCPIDRRAFFRLTVLAAGSLAIRPSLSAADPLTAVPLSRLDRLASGANICRWFRSPRGNPAEHFTGYISEDEVAFMTRMGLKHVRLCVAPRVIMDHTSGEIIEDRGKQLEAAIEELRQACARHIASGKRILLQ